MPRNILVTVGRGQVITVPPVVTVYAKPSGAPNSVWAVSVQGQPTWTHHTDRGGMAAYSTDAAGAVTITMTAPTTVTAVQVETSQPGVWPPPAINATFSGTGITFTLPKGFNGHVMVRINDALAGGLSWQNFCTVSALPLEIDVPTAGQVTYYFGPGVHTGSAIILTSGQSVYVAGGALLKRRIIAGTIGSGGRTTNLRIFGRGIIDTTNGYTSTSTGLGTGDFSRVDGFDMQGVGYVNRYGWGLAFYGCTDVVIDWLRLTSADIWDAADYGSQGTPDGINPIACNRFTVKRSMISASDDSHAVKLSKLGESGSGTAHLFEDLLLVQGGKSNMADIGYELGTTNLSITGVTFRRINAPICFRDDGLFRTSLLSVHVPTYATVDTVLWEDIHLPLDGASSGVNPKEWDIFISTFYSSYTGSVAGDASRGYIRNLTFRRVRWPATNNRPVRISADLTDPNYEGGAKKITNLTFDQCYRGGGLIVAAQGDWTVNNVTGLQFT